MLHKHSTTKTRGAMSQDLPLCLRVAMTTQMHHQDPEIKAKEVTRLKRLDSQQTNQLLRLKVPL